MRNQTLSKRMRPGLALLLLFGLAWPALLVAEDAPSAEDLLDKYVEVTGGEKAYQKIENRVTTGKVDMSAQGIVMQLEIYAARPNVNYTVLESDVTGKIERGTDGDVVWESSAMMGPQIKEGQERADYLRESNFDRWPGWRELYPTVEYAGTETVGEKEAHKVVATPKEGKPQTMYFDPDSNLLVRLDMVIENPMGTIPLSTFLSDYREVDGVLLAHATRVEVMGQTREIIIEKVEHNVDLPADRFELPAEIRAMLDKDSDAVAADAQSSE